MHEEPAPPLTHRKKQKTTDKVEPTPGSEPKIGVPYRETKGKVQKVQAPPTPTARGRGAKTAGGGTHEARNPPSIAKKIQKQLKEKHTKRKAKQGEPPTPAHPLFHLIKRHTITSHRGH